MTARIGPWTNAQLDKFIERATVDAYDEDEPRVGFFTMIEDNLASICGYRIRCRQGRSG